MLLSVFFVNFYLVISSFAQVDSVDWNNISSNTNVDELWQSFKTKFNKTYENADAESMRFQIFRDNVKMISEHNEQFAARLTTYKMGLNSFSDYTFDEFRKMMGLIG